MRNPIRKLTTKGLVKVMSKVIKVEGRCARCGSRNVGFEERDGECRLICRDCGSEEIADLSFRHARKEFRAEMVKGVKVEWSEKTS